VLIETFGVTGTSAWAASMNVLAALGALAASRGIPECSQEASELSLSRFSPHTWRILTAGFLSGATLLALEVVWFRFLQLFLPGTTLTFAVMLSIVLMGIGLGGLGASIWLKRFPLAHRRACTIAMTSGAVSILVYRLFDLAVGERTEVHLSGYGLESFFLCLLLMFPVSLLSGIFFSLLGQAIHEELRNETRAAGLLTLANTLGATLGPLVAGFFLIPHFGMERSFFVLALLYAAVALLLADSISWRVPRRCLPEYGLAAGFLVAAVFFPFGQMRRYLSIASASYREKGAQVVAVREGLTETIQYVREDFMGRPMSYRLVTNSFSMASTHATSRRYMKYYAYWPVALHLGLRSALLISFGCGSTAKALVDTRSLESIVVVDISRDILDLADVVFPDPGENPLEDPRVETYVEDGRFYLQTSGRRFDLITAEPPPPKLAGIVNLYSQEYFQLLYDHLTEGGIVTYWLPVSQLSQEETKAIVKAFLEVFGDETTLWNGCGLNWMLVGTRNAHGPVSEEEFVAQWTDPGMAPEMHELGFEEPGQIGATFMMGAEDLRVLTGRSLPLTDDHPKRLSSRLSTDLGSIATYASWMDTSATRKRFEDSAYVRRMFPDSIRDASFDFFLGQEALNRITAYSLSSGEVDFALLHAVLSKTSLEIPILWACGTSIAAQAILRELPQEKVERDPSITYQAAVGAMAERDYVEAERLMSQYQRSNPSQRIAMTRVYLLCLARRFDQARDLVHQTPQWFQEDGGGRAFLSWLDKTLGFSVARASRAATPDPHHGSFAAATAVPPAGGSYQLPIIPLLGSFHSF